MGSGCLPFGFRRNSCFRAPADLLNLYVVVLSLWKYVTFPSGAFGINCITAAVYASPNVCRLLLADFSLFLFFAPYRW